MIIEQVRERVLSDERLEKLVTRINDKLKSSYSRLKDDLASIDGELRDTKIRLSKLYDALETEKLSINELAPRIKEMREKQESLLKARVQIKASCNSLQPACTKRRETYWRSSSAYYTLWWS